MGWAGLGWAGLGWWRSVSEDTSFSRTAQTASQPDKHTDRQPGRQTDAQTVESPQQNFSSCPTFSEAHHE
ncbi:hypothetical protein E2C01_099765 [Portunus trituberculatus]|uniref:Uncharacterized protein n=1 Tax=Portunus trituberculatus TaxID=210409 RepID=A0A5B7KHN5_PORTR|nr:hypothetical protein [Portunus trituberculatus]